MVGVRGPVRNREASDVSETEGIKTVLHPVTDLAAAKAVFTALLGSPPWSTATTSATTSRRSARR